MSAEVITGRFGDGHKARGEGPYSLPESAKIGLPILDQAHMSLLAHLNAAHAALVAGDDAKARLQLETLRSEMATHFDIEEQIMQALGLPALRDHVRQHATKEAQVDGICRASLARGALTIGDIDQCFQLLIDEVVRGDLELKSHFQSMGCAPIHQRGA